MLIIAEFPTHLIRKQLLLKYVLLLHLFQFFVTQSDLRLLQFKKLE